MNKQLPSAKSNNRGGAALLLTIVISAVCLSLVFGGAALIVASRSGTARLIEREKAFWLAEGAIAEGRWQLKHNSGWFTDPAHYPSDDRDWLKGKLQFFEAKSSLAVRELGKSCLYGIGRQGEAMVIIKVQFDPISQKVIEWREI
ncbi:hypothetical protein A2311_05735 [candidate division WOR-1 bacterium RIFOXYB2_FULL_48_7]|uniref:Type 4 fimbrial biogenesis protein PilX N-terminal domain-containing protein n=1 Tax=candidate division WOR-1 bacterium RIFOXYB2_FULL_48_7 TaxID=1802583 RepID=A0A1F4TU55_UNCSA|nr:MAG: hypothetical protein A2311_05735 [candidate division WOR-1 bacterium RIFOXYB2_FULL_48_7]